MHDDPESFIYPMPLMISGKFGFCGRIRMDATHENCINIFVCGNNIRKGAASAAVQIAQALINYCRR